MENKEKITEALKKLQSLEEEKEVENIVKNNIIMFESKGVKYRIQLPNSEQAVEINNVRRKKRIEFMNDGSYLLKEQWNEIYKKKGVNIEEMNKEVTKIDGEIKTLYLELATKSEEKVVKELNEQLDKLKNDRIAKSMEITDLLSDSLESQLQIFVDGYVAYTILQRKEADKWVKHFENYDVFSKCEDADLLSQLFYYLSYLMYGKSE